MRPWYTHTYTQTHTHTYTHTHRHTYTHGASSSRTPRGELAGYTDSDWAGCRKTAKQGGLRCGWPQGRWHWVWEGPSRPVHTEDVSSSSFARLSYLVFLRGRDESPDLGERTQPRSTVSFFYFVSPCMELVVSLKNTTKCLIVMLAATCRGRWKLRNLSCGRACCRLAEHLKCVFCHPREVHGRMRCEVTDEDDSLSCSMMIKAKNTLLNAVWINHVASEICFQPLHPDTGLVDPSQLRAN